MIDPALKLLHDSNVPAIARGARYRALLQTLGPHVPVSILVPGASVDEARAILSKELKDL